VHSVLTLPPLILACLLVPLHAGTSPAARAGENPGRPVHTYSIVARDTLTGELGVAVQSHWYSVGTLVPWAEAGVGAVATQSFVDVSYGPLGLDLMRAGKSAGQALEALLAADSSREVRQVAMIDARGGVAAHTGSRCIERAGHLVGKSYSVQANLMRNSSVWGAMAAAYESSGGDLAERLLAALEAGEAAGGDIRGSQSAAILIVSGHPSGRPWQDRLMDLRVEVSPDPVADLAVEHDDIEGALREYGAAEAMVPDNLEMRFWHAVALVNAGRLEDSLPIFRDVFAADPSWAELIVRLPASGTLIAGEERLARILSVAPAR
jgi:uncharacterized Ntn-hydrolase superfamily protein